MTVAALEQKALKLPAADRVRLAETIIESVEDYADPEVAEAWQKEIARRIKDIDSGTAEGILAAQVFAQARKKLHAARRLLSARRK
jgi:putative addiction module component (TIGR02574 family)